MRERSGSQRAISVRSALRHDADAHITTVATVYISLFFFWLPTQRTAAAVSGLGCSGPARARPAPVKGRWG